MTELSEAGTVARNLARNCGYHVLPLRADGTTPSGVGAGEATADPTRIADLWSHPSATLVGIATGKVSNLAVISVDTGKAAACTCWRQQHPSTPVTRTYQSPVGFDLYFEHRPGLRRRICDGVAGLSDGDFTVFWFGAGYEALDHSPPAQWPVAGRRAG